MRQVIEQTKGKYFSVVFTKKDKSVRRMTARLGVKKGVNGKGMRYNPTDRNLMVVWDNGLQDFRMINLDTIQYFKCGAIEIHNA
jgi:hypothetical protein